MKGITILFAAAMAPLAMAHMVMQIPLPLRFSKNPNTKTADYNYKSPLDKSGSDYPCKGHLTAIGTPEGESVASWTAGSRQSFDIDGLAFHGGGSCQASFSEDGGKTFRVVKSFIGACPPRSGKSTFSFTVPASAKAGPAIFAWTWFNRMGNREMYMNCASVTITGGGGSGLTDLPEIFKANIGNGCATNSTGEQRVIKFPNPGSDVEDSGEQSFSPSGNCAAGSGAGAGSGLPGGAGTSGAPAAPSGFTDVPPKVSTAPSVPPGVSTNLEINTTSPPRVGPPGTAPPQDSAPATTPSKIPSSYAPAPPGAPPSAPAIISTGFEINTTKPPNIPGSTGAAPSAPCTASTANGPGPSYVASPAPSVPTASTPTKLETAAPPPNASTSVTTPLQSPSVGGGYGLDPDYGSGGTSEDATTGIPTPTQVDGPPATTSPQTLTSTSNPRCRCECNGKVFSIVEA